jgi:hypothetical protein
MAFPHPKSRKRNYWNRDIPNNGSVVWKFLKRTINITDYRNGEDEVNPAKDRTPWQRQSSNPFPLRICGMNFSILDSRVLDCFGAEK